MAFSITQAHDASISGETPNTPVGRAAAFRIVVDGVLAGLPVPERTNSWHFNMLDLMFDDADTAAVDRWATYLDLAAPTRRTHVHGVDSDQPWLTYEAASDHRVSPGLPGWSVRVSCLVVATDAEVTAARDAAKATV